MLAPAEILRLARRNRRTPWNWLMQGLGWLFLCLALLLHSGALFVFFLVLFAAGFLNLNLPEMPDNAFRRLAESGVAFEDRVLQLPPGWRRAAIWAGLLFAVCFVLWTLWSRSLIALCFLMGGGALARIVASNRASGIRP
ncbi:hypothetical protein [Salidesulfovibrio brasiliensis]|uniref:hypothetical protein n=1 Tax=Salidesulfovibrio brasiliensis TaxID=221711 RepID=UPI0006D2567D|nr:hypothetical protein [Salidesulfovibrio brasiliensis]